MKGLPAVWTGGLHLEMQRRQSGRALGAGPTHTPVTAAWEAGRSQQRGGVRARPRACGLCRPALRCTAQLPGAPGPVLLLGLLQQPERGPVPSPRETCVFHLLSPALAWFWGWLCRSGRPSHRAPWTQQHCAGARCHAPPWAGRLGPPCRVARGEPASAGHALTHTLGRGPAHPGGWLDLSCSSQVQD